MNVASWCRGQRCRGQRCRNVVPWPAGYVIFGVMDNVAATLYLGRLVTLFLVPLATLPRRRSTLVGYVNFWTMGYIAVTSLIGRRTMDLECIISGLSRDHTGLHSVLTLL